MSLAEFTSQKNVIERLQRSLENGRLGHAYLFSGQDLGELEKVGRVLAQTLNCQGSTLAELAADACGCISCRKIANDNHPDVKKLYGHCPRAKYWILLSVFIQFLLAYILKNQSWPIVILMAYTVGGVINHSLLLGMHELSHNLVFKKSTTNIWFSFC